MITNMTTFNRHLQNWLILFVSLVLFTSCAVTNSTSGYDKTVFLFIPIDGVATKISCILFLGMQLIAVFLNLFYTRKPGWRHEEIRRNIYNNQGDKIGSYDTGQYDSWYVSPEAADKTTTNVRFWAGVARIALPRAFITGCVAGWIFGKHIFWAIVLWLAVAPIWTIKRFNQTNDSKRTILWEVLYCILILVCIIVYAKYN